MSTRKNKTEEATENQQQPENAQINEPTASAEDQQKQPQTNDDAAENQKEPDNEKEEETIQGQETPLVESVGLLSSRHRIPSWQKAALLRFMDWEDDKMVTEAEFGAALKSLQTRRIGGGRM